MEIYHKDDLIASGVTVGIRRSEGCVFCDVHTHDFIEIVAILNGEATETIDGVSHRVRRGDMIFMNYGATHSFSSEEGFSHVEIFFSPDLLSGDTVTEKNALSLLALSAFDRLRGEEGGGVVSFHGEDAREAEFILSAMLREASRGDAVSASVIENYLGVLLAKMARNATEGTTLPDDVFASLRTYIDEHPEEKLSLGALAKKCFYNPSYLSRAFKQRFGLSPSEYVKERRLSLAAELLLAGSDTVECVMEKVGYTDRTAFYAAFAKRYGATPAEYRKGKNGKN